MKKDSIKIIEKHLNLNLSKFKKDLSKPEKNTPDKESSYFDEFENFTLQEFDSITGGFFNNIINNHFRSENVSIEFRDKFKELLYIYLKSKEDYTNHTGLIFVGYGNDEIYPSLIPMRIFLGLGSRLRFSIISEKEAAISNEKEGAICPFAQTDVMDTIINGIDTDLEKIYYENFKVFLKKEYRKMADFVRGNNPDLALRIDKLHAADLIAQIEATNKKIKKAKFVNPLMDGLATLSKEDLAEMAETLIYLTFLKRRVTFAEETVVGPVDVAIISKGDGFIWIKRKLYFKPEINQHFFSNTNSKPTT